MGIRSTFAFFSLVFLLLNGSSVVDAKIAIFSGQSLRTGEYLEDGPYRLLMQTDCNLVLYLNREWPLWSTGTNNRGNSCSAKLQRNGALVVLNGNGSPLWISGSASVLGRYVLTVQGDGNVVIYPPSIWSSHTSKDQISLQLESQDSY